MIEKGSAVRNFTLGNDPDGIIGSKETIHIDCPLSSSSILELDNNSFNITTSSST